MVWYEVEEVFALEDLSLSRDLCNVVKVDALNFLAKREDLHGPFGFWLRLQEDFSIALRNLVICVWLVEKPA